MLNLQAASKTNLLLQVNCPPGAGVGKGAEDERTVRYSVNSLCEDKSGVGLKGWLGYTKTLCANR